MEPREPSGAEWSRAEPSGAERSRVEPSGAEWGPVDPYSATERLKVSVGKGPPCRSLAVAAVAHAMDADACKAEGNAAMARASMGVWARARGRCFGRRADTCPRKSLVGPLDFLSSLC